VALTNGNGLTLSIADDGNGFEPVAANGTGFGLVSMSERARALGGEFRIVSSTADGTAVEVALPQAALE
jgi:signal transduction histidine kinase